MRNNLKALKAAKEAASKAFARLGLDTTVCRYQGHQEVKVEGRAGLKNYSVVLTLLFWIGSRWNPYQITVHLNKEGDEADWKPLVASGEAAVDSSSSLIFHFDDEGKCIGITRPESDPVFPYPEFIEEEKS